MWQDAARRALARQGGETVPQIKGPHGGIRLGAHGRFIARKSDGRPVAVADGDPGRISDWICARPLALVADQQH
jgi:hypothetical protein